MGTTTLMMPVEVNLAGVRLKRTKVFEVGDGKKKEQMTMSVDFWAAAVVTGTNTAEDGVQGCSDERMFYGTPYRSVNVKLSDGEVHSIVFKSNRDQALKLKIGEAYNFEGTELPPTARTLKRDGKVVATLAPRRILVCDAIVKGKLKITDTHQYQ